MKVKTRKKPPVRFLRALRVAQADAMLCIAHDFRPEQLKAKLGTRKAQALYESEKRALIRRYRRILPRV